MGSVNDLKERCESDVSTASGSLSKDLDDISECVSEDTDNLEEDFSRPQRVRTSKIIVTRSEEGSIFRT